MCERVWRKSSRVCTQQGLMIGSRDWLMASKSPKLAHMWSMQRSWRVTPAGALQDKTSSLAKQLARDSNLRLNQVARWSRQTTLFGKNWPFVFQTHTSINTPYTHVLQRASRENFERETLEKKKDWFIHNHHSLILQIPLLSPPPLLHPWEIH